MGNVKANYGSRKTISQQRLRYLLHYDHLTGDFTWLRNRNSKLVGGKAGHLNRLGYVVIRVDRNLFLAHRLAWLYRIGEWPINDIDHINRNRSDNRFANLRDVPRGLNRANSALGRNNTSGLRGVSPEGDKWRAQIKVDKRTRQLGLHDTPEAALDAYTRAASAIPGRITGPLKAEANQ